MFATQYLLPSSRNSIAAVDEARPVGRNKRFSFGRKDTKPRLFVPTKRKSAMRIKAAAALTTTPNQMNAVVWLQGNDCPMDVMPKILAYAGPQMAQTLSKCNHFWNNVMQDEATWRSLCEELYKVCFYSIVVLFDAIVAIAGPLSTYSSSVHVVLRCALLLQLFPVRSIVVFKKLWSPWWCDWSTRSSYGISIHHACCSLASLFWRSRYFVNATVCSHAMSEEWSW